MTASELARQYGDKIVAISVHPGVFQSELYRHTPAFFSNIFVRTASYAPHVRLIGVYSFHEQLKIFGFSIAHGAMTQLYAGGSREAEHYSGKVCGYMRFVLLPSGDR
jgi:hypothetical protein